MRRLQKALSLLLTLVIGMTLLSGCGDKGDKPIVTPPDASYTVTFDVGAEAKAAGVSTPASQTVMRDAKAVEPTMDYWQGHELIGWFKGETQWNFSTNTVSENITLAAKWREAAAGNVAEEYEANLDWGEPGHLYIHYLHGADDLNEHGTVSGAAAPEYAEPIDSAVYGDWGLWVWEYLPVNSEGRAFYPMKLDESGAVYDIKLDQTYNDAGWDAVDRDNKGLEITYNTATWLGIQVFSHDSRINGQGFWVNDGGDVYVNLADAKREKGDYHWFVSQGEVQNGTPTYTVSEVFDPYEGIEYGSAVTSYDVVSNKGNNDTYTLQPVAEGWEDDAIGYQIFIASFADSDGDGMGDLKGITQNLDYLQDLNVDVLWLTPFQQSNSYHGYDIKNYFTVDPRFGTLDDYRELLFEAHKRGMKVLLDFVLNHTSTSNPWFEKSTKLIKETVKMPDGSLKVIDYRNFYNWRSEDTVPKSGAAAKQWFKDPNGYYYFSSFNSGMPELNFDYQATRDAILEVALYWMSFGLDGFRLDAAKHIYMENENDQHSSRIIKDVDTKGTPDTSDDQDYSYDLKKNNHFFRELNAKLKASYPNALLLAENLTGDPAKLAGMYEGLDSQFNFNFYYDTTGCFGEAAKFTGVWPGGNDYVGKIMNKYECGQLNFAAAKPDYIDSLFTSNHDVQRARDRLLATFNDSINDWVSPGVQNAADVELSGKLAKLYAGMVLTLPGVSWIYYGDELGMFGTKSANADGSIGHEDRMYRQPMKWTTEKAGSNFNCQYPIGFNNYVMSWDKNNAALPGAAEQATDANSIYSFYKTFTTLRKSSKAFTRGTVKNLYPDQDQASSPGPAFGYSVSDGTDTFYVFINPTGTARLPDLFKGGDAYRTGKIVYAPDGWANGQALPGYSIVVLQN